MLDPKFLDHWCSDQRGGMTIAYAFVIAIIAAAIAGAMSILA